MSLLGNILWLIFGGLLSGLGWVLAGALWCVTIIGIPVGLQCFKLAQLSFAPFGREVVYEGGAPSFIINVIWFIVSGLLLALENFLLGCVLCVTIIGIPVGLQCFKLAQLSFAPFGREVVYNGGAPSFIINVIWFLLSGLVLALGNFLMGCLLCVTIIGIPFGKQFFKIAKLALAPFGAVVV
jgi:uncharacterized membrane protein YccF (DUF307 family)